MSDIDSLIRERLDGAAAFDVVTDPRGVREKVARRQRRIRRRRRTTALLSVLAVAGVAVGMVRALGQDSGGDVAVRTEAPTESGPRFLPSPGWETFETGVTSPPQAPAAVAANVPLGPATLSGNVPWDTVERLEAGDVVLFAMFVPTGESSAVDANFPRRELPLSLDAAQPGGLEGQPDDIYAERLLAQVNGWNIDLLIFYGDTEPTGEPPTHIDPSAETRAVAQGQLARLVVPAREPPALSPAPEDACQPSNLQADVQLENTDGTLAGHISIRNLGDSVCALEGRSRVELSDGKADSSPSTSDAAPAWERAGAEPPDGWPTIRVAPQSEFRAVLRIRNWCVQPGAPVYFLIRLPHHIDRISGIAPSVRIPPQCDDPQLPVELSLGPFEPPRSSE